MLHIFPQLQSIKLNSSPSSQKIWLWQVDNSQCWMNKKGNYVYWLFVIEYIKFVAKFISKLIGINELKKFSKKLEQKCKNNNKKWNNQARKRREGDKNDTTNTLLASSLNNQKWNQERWIGKSPVKTSYTPRSWKEGRISYVLIIEFKKENMRWHEIGKILTVMRNSVTVYRAHVVAWNNLILFLYVPILYSSNIQDTYLKFNFTWRFHKRKVKYVMNPL